MATEEASSAIAARLYCGSGYYSSGNSCYSSWYWWGRWVFAGVVILVILGILVLLGCINARRRRRRGTVPMYGTGWMSKNTQPQNVQAYAPQGHQYGPPPPQYSPNAPTNTVPNQYTGNTLNSNDGYYGHHNEGIQLQQPANAYARGGDNGYEPPPGPPPSKVA